MSSQSFRFRVQAVGASLMCLATLSFSGCGGSSGGDARFLFIGIGGPSGVGPGTGQPGPGNGDPAIFQPPSQPSADRLYVTQSQEGTLGVYDAETYQPIDEIFVGSDPRGLSYDTGRERILISLSGGSGTGSVVSLDAAHLNTAPLTVPSGGGSSLDLAYDATNDVVWASSLSFAVAAFRGSDLTPLSGSPITPVYGAATVVVEPNGNRVFVSESLFSGGALAVIDAATRTLLAEVDTSPNDTEIADGLAYHPGFQHLYLGNLGTDPDTLLALDASTTIPTIIQTVSSGEGPASIEVDTGRNRIYVVNFEADTLTVYPVSNSPTAPIGSPISVLTTGEEPIDVYYDAIRDRILVANLSGDSLTVYNAATLTQLTGSPFPLGDGPYALEIQPAP